MQKSYENRLKRAKKALDEAEYVLIGGGSGLSSAAGLTYSGRRFEENFADFIRRYHVTDMYSAGFTPFPSEEEKWAYWSRHILFNRYLPPALPLYLTLYALVKDKKYFVLTTNVDGAFSKAGFDEARLFEAQGNYGLFQCAKGCHDTLYDNEASVRAMAEVQQDCRIPARLVPSCPVCGGKMEVHVRKNAFFVQDAAWYRAAERYREFLSQAEGKRTALLELGVGFNTPTIIRFPFERLTHRNAATTLIRVNRDFPEGAEENGKRTVAFSENMLRVIEGLTLA